MNWDKKLFDGFLREDDGSPSSSRLLTALVIVASVIWISYVVIKTKALPELGSVAVFDTTIAGSLYGLNKVVRTFTGGGKGDVNTPAQ